MFTFDQAFDGIDFSMGEINGSDDQFQYVYRVVDQQPLDRLKALRDNTNLDNDAERLVFLREIDALICNWDASQPLDLRQVFSKQDIDYLLKLPRFVDTELTGRELTGDRLVEFLIRAGYKDEPDYDELGQPQLRRTTPIHHWAKENYFLYGGAKVFELFAIYDKYWANYADADSGLTHFHVACLYGRVDVATKFLEAGIDVNCGGYSRCDSPLHCSLVWGHAQLAQLLLANGADPTSSNGDGTTPLHIICMGKDESYYHLAQWLIESSQQLNKPVLISGQDKRGNTPLHLALDNGFAMLAELLLRCGADLNLPNGELYTPLHCICKQKLDDQSGQSLLQTFIEKLETVTDIDVRDKFDNTPLHLALRHGNNRIAEELLRRGADPNAVNIGRFTPLHIVCKRQRGDVDAVKLIFDICNEKQLHVQINAVGMLNRTPLQWAVANLMPDVVDALLDRGADLTTFVFPTRSYFATSWSHVEVENGPSFKFRQAADALAVTERLEKRGYELKRSDAMTIMSLFARHELFESPVDLDTLWQDDEEFVCKAKRIEIIEGGLSLYELLKLPAEETTRNHALYRDRLIRLGRSEALADLPRSATEVCVEKLCEIMARGFFRDSATHPLRELVKYRLPVLCCRMIVETLSNQDSYNVCLAAE